VADQVDIAVDLGARRLQRFTALLGDDVFFVSCEWGTKTPLLTYTERPFESTQSEAYRAVSWNKRTSRFIWAKRQADCARSISTVTRKQPH
jgi:hypothetical protein